jgi:histidine triad (HIT) family protein
MNECVFCNILSGKLPSSIAHQDGLCTALMDIQPVNPGHVLVVPNNHGISMADLNDEIGAHLFCVAKRVAAALRRGGIRCEGVNLLLADGEAAGQEVFHVHLHVFPRYKGDGFGFKFGRAYSNKPDRTELDVVAEQIRNGL